LNIFYLHEDPRKAAEYQYNKHVVKMILESAQMLCTAHHHFDNGDNVPYKKAHYNHPSTIWVRQNSRNYYWLYNHMLALGKEYTRRYGKTHLSITKCWESLQNVPVGMPLGGPVTQPPQCMPDEYKADCAIHAYWNYYLGDKHRVANSNETIKTKMYEREIKTKD
tara:strand:+ start:186 stop:680 length:495 start_codon:yes stop_codon:yes gene_type:complete